MVEKVVTSGKALTSFGSGGKVTVLYPSDVGELIGLSRELKGSKFGIIGGGTNVLIPDGGTDFPLIGTAKLKKVVYTTDGVWVQCGVRLPSLAAELAARDLTIGEGLAGIPGTVGGAVIMNAGAFNSQTSDYISHIAVLNGDCVQIVSKNDAGFGYRTSGLKGRTVIAALFRPLGKRRDDIIAETARCALKRRQTQPSLPSCGSVFKRAGGVSAGFYIERAGLKGLADGGARISLKHANFIVNEGGATTEQFLRLQALAAEKVYDKYKITLEKEFELIE